MTLYNSAPFSYSPTMDFLTQLPLLQLSDWQLFFTVLVFIWSGFVRSGLGFGGAALGLPLMLLIDDRPIFWLPIIGTHLLIFTSMTLRTRLSNVDWSYLRRSLVFILPAKLVGVFGLLNLPNSWLVLMIYGITLIYSLLWIFNLSIHSEKGWTDKLFLTIGGYVSGTSLTGAPLIVAVYMNHIDKKQLRNTLFVLWFLLVTIKMGTFAVFDVDLQTLSALLLVPIAAVGHVIGLKAHDYMMQNDQRFKMVLGSVLFVICALGLSSLSRA